MYNDSGVTDKTSRTSTSASATINYSTTKSRDSEPAKNQSSNQAVLSPAVIELVSALTDRINISPATLSPSELARAIFGMQYLSADVPETRKLLQALIAKAPITVEPYNSEFNNNFITRNEVDSSIKSSGKDEDIVYMDYDVDFGFKSSHTKPTLTGQEITMVN